MKRADGTILMDGAELFKAICHVAGRAEIDRAAVVQIQAAVKLQQGIVAIGVVIAIRRVAQQIHLVGVQRDVERIGGNDAYTGDARGGIGISNLIGRPVVEVHRSTRQR